MILDKRHLTNFMIDKCFTMVLLNLPEKYIDSFGRASYIKCTEKKRLEAMTKR